MLGQIAKQAIRADLLDRGDDGSLVGAILDVLLELLERVHLGQGTALAVALGHRDVDEAHAVVLLEGRVPEAGGLGVVELVVDGPDELLVLLDPVGLDLVANQYLSHLDPPGFVCLCVSVSRRPRALGLRRPERSSAGGRAAPGRRALRPATARRRRRWRARTRRGRRRVRRSCQRRRRPPRPPRSRRRRRARASCCWRRRPCRRPPARPNPPPSSAPTGSPSKRRCPPRSTEAGTASSSVPGRRSARSSPSPPPAGP